jgi:hypothetical protein
MRNLFLALLLANLGFAAWHNWFAADERGLRAEADEDLPGITLVSELDAQPQGGSADAPPVSAADAPAGAPDSGGEAPSAAAAAREPSCVSIGPFRELSQAATAASRLRADGFDPSQRVAEGDIWVGYWVYIGGIPTRAQANDILASLREQGITDAYVIPDTDSGNLVSLGVFSEVRRAGRRREQVRALGYDVTVTDRTRRGTVYWVDIELPDGQEVDFDQLQPAGRIIRLEQRPCGSV